MSPDHLGLSALVAAAVASDSLEGSHSRSRASSSSSASYSSAAPIGSAPSPSLVSAGQGHQPAQLPAHHPPALRPQSPSQLMSVSSHQPSLYPQPLGGSNNGVYYAGPDHNTGLYSGSVRHSYDRSGNAPPPPVNNAYVHASYASLPMEHQPFGYADPKAPAYKYSPSSSLYVPPSAPQYSAAPAYSYSRAPPANGVDAGISNNPSGYPYSANHNNNNDAYRFGYGQHYPAPMNSSGRMANVPFNPPSYAHINNIAATSGPPYHNPNEVHLPSIDPGRKGFLAHPSNLRPPTPPQHNQREIISLPPIYHLRNNNAECSPIPTQELSIKLKLESNNANESVVANNLGSNLENKKSSCANESSSKLLKITSRKRKSTFSDDREEDDASLTTNCVAADKFTTRSSRSNSASSTTSIVSNHSNHSDHSDTSVTSISTNGSSTNPTATEDTQSDAVPSFGLSSLNRKKRQCSICQGWFSNLATHKSIHVSDKSRPHACKVCGRGFARPNDLFRHQKSHRGDAPFNCPFYKPAQIVTSTDNTAIMNSPSCHQTGGFSRCDTFKNHLKAMHFAYPLGVKKKDRNGAKGRCKHCGMHFESVEDWITNHVETGDCTKLVGRIKLGIEPCNVIINTIPDEKL